MMQEGESAGLDPREPKQVLFLCTGNYYRSRFAECLFNLLAGKMGLPWTASSRGLALERGMNNVGAMEVTAIKALEAHGLRGSADFARFPMQVSVDDLESADLIIALKKAEHMPLLQERFPTWIDKVEYWQVDDAPVALAVIEREIMDLTERLREEDKRGEQKAGGG
jgi:protein-tyrosine phosphatase